MTLLFGYVAVSTILFQHVSPYRLLQENVFIVTTEQMKNTHVKYNTVHIWYRIHHAKNATIQQRLRYTPPSCESSITRLPTSILIGYWNHKNKFRVKGVCPLHLCAQTNWGMILSYTGSPTERGIWPQKVWFRALVITYVDSKLAISKHIVLVYYQGHSPLILMIRATPGHYLLLYKSNCKCGEYRCPLGGAKVP